ncbi:putative NCS1 allantoate transporter [Ilyonectria robusta]
MTMLTGSLPPAEALKARISSIEAWRLPQEPGTLAPPGVASNKDQDPVPEHQWTWTGWDFATYWMSDLINITSWQIAASAMLVGLSTADAVVITLLSGVLNSIPTVLNGGPGVDHRIPFPIAVRSAYGYYFGSFCVVSRAIIAMTWFGVNCWVGSAAMTETIAALWPEYRTIKNHLPASAHITTQKMVSYFLFFLAQLPFFIIPLHKLRKLFLWKAILLLPVSVAMVLWICVKAGDVKGIFAQPATVSGSTRVWLWLSTFSGITNSWLTSAANMSDFSRFSKTRYAPYSQIPTIPIVKTVYAILGIATVGAGRVLYSEDIWSPIELLPKWTGSGGRFLAFFCGCLWMLAQISCSVSANSVPFGHDVMSLAPAWINVRRGSMLCLFLGSWAVVPWFLVSSASQFLLFMNGYGCFICAMVSIMICDYWVVNRRRLDIPALYNPHGRYRFTGGFNWRAAVVQFGFLAIFLPGIIHQINPSVQISTVMERIFHLNWFISTIGPFIVYWMLNQVFPHRATKLSASIAVMDGQTLDASQSVASDKESSKQTDNEKPTIAGN